MKAKEGIIELLNKILTAELTVINQYFIHSKMCENWGYERLHHKVRERSMAEMKD
ncbi:MAG: bacterioferritin, partial [Nitrospirae bacterium]